ncbi:MAG: RNA-binding domain-containing protein [archaeon]
MKLCNIIKVTVFAKPEDNCEKIGKVFQKLFPFDFAEEKIKLKKQKTHGFNEREILVYEADLEKDRHINAFLKQLNAKLNKAQKELLLRQDNRLDEHLNFFIRLDKPKLLKGKYALTDCGDCFHIKINIASFPRKKEKAKEILMEIFK